MDAIKGTKLRPAIDQFRERATSPSTRSNVTSGEDIRSCTLVGVFVPDAFPHSLTDSLTQRRKARKDQTRATLRALRLCVNKRANRSNEFTCEAFIGFILDATNGGHHRGRANDHPMTNRLTRVLRWMSWLSDQSLGSLGGSR